jgi:hypothetical protein
MMDDVIAYVSGDGRRITTWDGTVLMSVTSETAPRSAHFYAPLSQRLWYYRALDTNKNRWYGKGSGRNMAIRMHKAVGA